MGKGHDGLHYRGIGVVVDTGCGKARSCLACHLALCWHDMTPKQRRAWLRSQGEEDAPAGAAGYRRGTWTP